MTRNNPPRRPFNGATPLPFWLETRPANDAPENVEWRRFGEDTQSLVEAEDRARAVIRCKVVTPDGVRIVWSSGALPRGNAHRDQAPRAAAAPRLGPDARVPGHLRGLLDD